MPPANLINHKFALWVLEAVFGGRSANTGSPQGNDMPTTTMQPRLLLFKLLDIYLNNKVKIPPLGL